MKKPTREVVLSRIRSLESHARAVGGILNTSCSCDHSLDRSAQILGDVSDHAMSIAKDLAELAARDYSARVDSFLEMTTETAESKW